MNLKQITPKVYYRYTFKRARAQGILLHPPLFAFFIALLRNFTAPGLVFTPLLRPPGGQAGNSDWI
ncbi:hypothetical protein LJC36_05500 [Desulfovibrio sp. OttesenSCG-928-C14]|nr:hypothetical protein [Desulfovibrio sp. OttesenSCG-928-C14]